MEGLKEMELYEVGTGTATSDYYLVLTHAGGRITGRLEYNAELFKHTTAQRMASDWQVGPLMASLLPILLQVALLLVLVIHFENLHAMLHAHRIMGHRRTPHINIPRVVCGD